MQSNSSANSPLAVVKTYGKGRIASFLINQNKASNNDIYEAYKNEMASVVKSLFPNPIVEVAGSKKVHITVVNIKGQTIVNLINTSQYSDGVIPALPALKVSIRTSAKPVKLTLQPENKPLNFTYHNGICTAEIQTLSLHEIIVIGQ